jgi:hypothetical protein
MMDEPIDWLKPSPLWRLTEGDFRQSDFFRPAVVELRTDDFVEELFAAVGAPKPDALEALLLRPVDGAPLKLFQPVHGRYYMVCASLCCRIPGFPDRVVASGDGESTFFVLRRRLDGQEYAWVGAEGARTWQSLDGQPRRALPGEDRLPMAQTTAGNARPVQFGYLPVSSTETYKVPATQLADASAPPLDLRIEELGSRFTEPLTGPPDPVTGIPDPSTASIQLAHDDVARTVSVYLLLDAWEYLLEYLPDVAAALRGDPGAVPADPKLAEKQALIDLLGTIALGGSLTLADALGAVARQRDTLNQAGGVEGDSDLGDAGFDATYNLKQHTPSVADLLGLLDAVRAALSDELPPVDLPKLPPRDDAEYIVRLVYERGQCDPPRQFVSLPTPPLRLATFFDPDAPARTIRIPMPSDVSVAAMRRFKKGVSFMMSEAMQRKVEALRGKERGLIADDSTTLDEGLGVDFICSFSIQIIFIVAFFLLLMFVFILNIVFWWIFFFRICFPIPKSLAPK